MTKIQESPATTETVDSDVVEMSWDPITRIVGSLGIYATVDFKQKKVRECHSTSSIFRGYSIFMKGKDPRDSHFITSRICGICGDNHCDLLGVRAEHGVRRRSRRTSVSWIINLGEAAEYMFDHNIFQENLVGVDYCERMVRETNPGVLEKANRTESPHAGDHGYKTIGDIMRSLNPIEGDFYREALQVSRYTREMFCLMEGRHVHPSTLYPGGVGTTATVQLFTDYYIRLMRYCRVPEEGRAAARRPVRLLLRGAARLRARRRAARTARLLGRVPGPRGLRLHLPQDGRRGAARWASPRASSSTASSSRTAWSTSTSGIRILLGHSYYDDWADGAHEKFVDKDPLGNPVDVHHPWNQHTLPKPGRSATSTPPTAGRCRRAGSTAPTTSPSTPAAGRIARLWSTALSGLVDMTYVKATGHSVTFELPRTALKPADELRVEDPAVEQRARAQPGAHVLPALRGLRGARLRRAGPGRGPGRAHRDVGAVHRAGRGDQLRVHRGGARRAQPPHGDPRRQDRELPPVPADAVERQRARRLRHARPVRGRGAEHADLRGEPAGELQGHRHHAGGPQLRPVPAVRRAHVHRQRRHR